MKQLISFQLFCLTLGFLLPVYEAVQPVEVLALNSFKEAVFEDPFLVLSNWNSLDSDPCNWFGVSCSGSQVTKLNISGYSIKGFIAEELFQLSSLQELILHGNNLIGSIPMAIGSLKYLKVLDLGKNKLSGPIPPEIGNLDNILKINKLHGTVPGSNASGVSSGSRGMDKQGFCRSSSLKVADFSYNFLVGSIPKCLDYLPGTSFRGNCLHFKDAKQRTPEKCGIAPPAKTHTAGETRLRPAEDHDKSLTHDSKHVWILVIEVVIGVMVGSLFLIALLAVILRCKSKPSAMNLWKKSTNEKDRTSIYLDSNMLKGVARYNRQELEVACEDFSNIIGSSSDSLVYKGTMKGGPEIAVISLCIKEEHWTGYLELYYQKEVADLARLNHENTGKLLGYYEDGCNLSWSRRMKIVIGIAKGLKYLHTEIEPPFTISELNSSAVYLTEDFSPKLVDFESWKTILARSENNSRSISNEGDICVLPSSFEERHLDIQGNIYAFGVLLLEIVSGRPSFCKDKGCLVDWAKDYLEKQEEMGSVVDPALKYFRDEDLKVICEVVSLCLHLRPRDQISMKDVCGMLERTIDTSISSEAKASSLAWAELMLSP
ncbi:Leucine-rich repeat-containing protein [Cynara cardunculus var. scolymus]|uniref:Leucine-rich repeat-containing protein n=1 Tax=Cynara cardunculus var. scolymus TaxID=59895 RepID=A0A103XG83_CYNCS|nr:Leucine-rich repeat-containing protein [Cynara cardunculus var. scolymus]